ncbi:hypothetical protein CGRA01v4_07369 [Colletotrichum graminicola]|nr:hypothetical protein CGRA01v4_07369 [Colletotrichum graminicola]
MRLAILEISLFDSSHMQTCPLTPAIVVPLCLLRLLFIPGDARNHLLDNLLLGLLDARRHWPALAAEDADVLPLRHVLAVGVPQQAPDVRALVALDAHDLGRGVVDQRAADLDRRPAPPLAALARARAVQAVHDDEADGLLLRKVAVDVDHAGRQQAGLAEQGAVGAGVDVQRAVGLEAVDEPEMTVADRLRGGEEAGVQRGLLDGLVEAQGGGGLGQGVLGVVVVVVVVSVVVSAIMDGSGVQVRGGFLLCLDVAHDLDDVARVGGAGDHSGHACGCRQSCSHDLGHHAAGAEGGAGG